MSVINAANLTTAQRRQLLLSHLKTGQQASCEWVTESSGLTKRSIRLWAEEALASGDRRIVQPPSNKNPDMLNIVDMDKYNNPLIKYKWSTINLLTLKTFKAGRKTFIFG